MNISITNKSCLRMFFHCFPTSLKSFNEHHEVSRHVRGDKNSENRETSVMDLWIKSFYSDKFNIHLTSACMKLR